VFSKAFAQSILPLAGILGNAIRTRRWIDDVAGEFHDWLRPCLEIGWVAQATGLCRPATRRTEREGHPQLMMTACWSGQPLPFRSAGRRPGRASGPRHPFFKHALRQSSRVLNSPSHFRSTEAAQPLSDLLQIRHHHQTLTRSPCNELSIRTEARPRIGRQSDSGWRCSLSHESAGRQVVLQLESQKHSKSSPDLLCRPGVERSPKGLDGCALARIGAGKVIEQFECYSGGGTFARMASRRRSNVSSRLRISGVATPLLSAAARRPLAARLRRRQTSMV